MAVSRFRLLMCRPDFFEVAYVVNPWMDGNVGKTVAATARAQWSGLYDRLRVIAEVDVIEPRPGLPDMVFTANSGAVLGNRAVLGRFLHRERRGEEPHYREWFVGQGFDTYELPVELPFEGAGDALIDAGGWMWAGYGVRTELESHPLVSRWLDVEVCSLRLVDPRFYHLDTCLCPLDGGWLMYYPPAFDGRSNDLIASRVPPERRIAVGDCDAMCFACNAVNLGRRIFLNAASADLKAALAAGGFDVVETPLGEFIKAGGAAKCLTLRVDEPAPIGPGASSAVRGATVLVEGHLLDSGTLERALDVVADGGGSFRFSEFHLGQQRQSTSQAQIHVSAPSEEALGKVLSRLADLGAAVVSREETDAFLQQVAQPGVAPEEFYATTTFPTEVRFGGRWIPVQDQRMDGVVVVRGDGANAEARCTLFRRLRPGDRVIVGGAGIRRIRRPESRDDRARIEGEFAFMGSRVSSERRVGLAVERVAWQMQRMRGQGGRIVVVAGPVIIHAGAREHLAWLVREGYVQALLAGNGLAAHDIEQAMFGTSLGIDVRLGSGVRGGHRNHLRAINAICRCGGMGPAVEQGVLRSGIFFECVRRGVPFVLAASIRDDGPLPDTITDMVRAQDQYALHVKGAGMILMLGSMLHAIGVGNMAPPGVKMACVDINPAVVTKLADRGSMASAGIVADAGSFLSLLVERLRQFESGPVPEPGTSPAAG